MLVLHSTTHLPPGWAEGFGASLGWVWTFALRPVGSGRCRLLVRSRGRVAPWRVNAGYVAAVPAHHVMTRGMFRGLQRRVAR